MAKRAKRSSNAKPREDRDQFLQHSTKRNSNVHHLDMSFDKDNRENQRKKRVDIIPRNLTQERYLKALNNENEHIVFAMGPAGTGKTMLATQFAIKALKERQIDKIIITRPAVSVDEQHGFLPGTLVEKMAPWVIPIMDVFKEFYMPYQIEKMLEDEVIEIAPLAYMRGRNLKNCIVILDESQNVTPAQMKMFLTRISTGAKMIVTGDINQHDRGFEKNGLKDFIDRLEEKKVEGITVIKFDTSEIERHPVVETVLNLYGDDVV